MTLTEKAGLDIKKIGVITFAFLILEVALYLYADKPMAEYMRALDETSHGLIDFFRRITDLGKGAWYLWPCGIATIFCAFLSRGRDVPSPYRRLFGYIGVRALFIFATVGISGIVVDIIKPIAGRARPLLWLKDHIYGFDPLTTLGFAWNAMPSGHATTAIALAFALTKLYPRGGVLWFAYGLILSASRVMVDAHYLSDVCAGAFLGWLTVVLFSQYGMQTLAKIIFPIDTAPSKE